MDVFLTLAEVAVAMAGFSAIVVMFKRRASGGWRKIDADRFHGMVLHAIFATVFALLPFAFTLFAVSDAEALRWCCGLLGVATVVQVVAASRLESTSGLWIRIQIAGGGLLVLTLQAAGASGAFPEQALGIYFIGVFWHLVQAGMLFVLLVWIPESLIGPE